MPLFQWSLWLCCTAAQPSHVQPFVTLPADGQWIQVEAFRSRIRMAVNGCLAFDGRADQSRASCARLRSVRPLNVDGSAALERGGGTIEGGLGGAI